MQQITIKIENWKHISIKEVLKVIRKAIMEMSKNLSDNDLNNRLHHVHYNDYDKSGVELKITWK